MIGYGSIVLALIMTSIAALYYFNDFLTNNGRHIAKSGLNRTGTFFFNGAAVFVGAAAAYLMYIILSNHFEYAYVFGYSSRDLLLFYKISVFWAGQEGSFLLWLVFHVVFGLFLIRNKSGTSGAMAVYSLLQVMLLIILLFKSPFMVLAEPRLDGGGLNPLLQDPWMIIHPPIVFLGYAGLAVPFAFAVEGLLSNNHRLWLEKALPWTVFSWSALGAGIFIGGYWAYKVLGWGGYWAWDPVENSSLVPWLVAGALVHILLLTRVRPVAVKPAYFANIFSYVLVLYGTFLTRSGILSDFSTHSFGDEGVGALLATLVLATVFAALVLLIWRWPSLPSGEIYTRISSREFALACTGLVLAILAGLVLIGMSTPVITMLLGNPQNVSAIFYNTASLPLAAALAVLLAYGPVLEWGEQGIQLKRYQWLLIIGLAGVVAAIYAGLFQPFMIATIAFSLMALVSNAMLAIKNMKLHWSAALAHVGVAFMLIGIIISGMLNQSVTATLKTRQSQEIFGYRLSYQGIERTQEGFYQNFTAEGHNGEVFTLRPFTKFDKRGNPAAREPGIYKTIAADIYLSPIIKDEAESTMKEFTLRKGEKVSQGNVTLQLINIGMRDTGTKEGVRIQTVLQLSADGKTEEIKPELLYRNGQLTSNTLTVFNQYEVALKAVNPGEGTIMIDFGDLNTADSLESIDVEISRKPLISLVWAGAILITLGTTWAAVRRFRLLGTFTGLHSDNMKRRG